MREFVESVRRLSGVSLPKDAKAWSASGVEATADEEKEANADEVAVGVVAAEDD